jgi:hypothetical protein
MARVIVTRRNGRIKRYIKAEPIKAKTASVRITLEERAAIKAPKREHLTSKQWQRYGELVRIMHTQGMTYVREHSLADLEERYLQVKRAQALSIAV